MIFICKQDTMLTPIKIDQVDFIEMLLKSQHIRADLTGQKENQRWWSIKKTFSVSLRVFIHYFETVNVLSEFVSKIVDSSLICQFQTFACEYTNT